MRTKKFLTTAISSNAIKVYDATSKQLCRIITVEGVIKSLPRELNSVMEVVVERDEKKFVETYRLPNGQQISSKLL